MKIQVVLTGQRHNREPISKISLENGKYIIREAIDFDNLKDIFLYEGDTLRISDER